MEHNINRLLRYTMEATDGLIGNVKDFYFDDETWDIRYLVIETGGWLSGRDVLISPVALLQEKWHNGLFPVNLTKKQISSSPDIDTDKPIARQREIELYGHYEWENYWGSSLYGTDSIGVDQGEKRSDNKNHLRSTSTITGYHIHATDGEIGHVNDFIMDDESWQIKFIIVDTHNWFGSRKVMVPAGLIKNIDWADSEVFLEMSIGAVEKCSLFDEADFIHLQLAKQ